MLAILPIATRLVLLFGPPELFLLAVLGLVIVSTASRGKTLRGLICGALGLPIAFIGYDDVTGSVSPPAALIFGMAFTSFQR